MDDQHTYNLPPEIEDTSYFSDDKAPSIIKVIGVGGGGGNAVNYMFKQNIPYVNFVLCNTDAQHLEKSPVPTKIILGPEITKGLGAGNRPEVGRECAEASAEDIRALFNDNTEMVFITAGMGGGTGTGAAPVVARIAKEAGMLTIGIVTVPFFFEGDKKIIKALEGAEEMKKHVDSLLVINNENLIELYKDLNLFNAFEKADDTLANAARSISEIISENCYINVDFQDVKTTLKESGTAIIATAFGEGPNRVSRAINGALHSPLLKAHDLKTSKRLLFKIVCSRENDNAISMKEMNEIREFTDTLPDSIDVKWGVGDDPAMGEKVKITVLASGFDVTLGSTRKDSPEGGSKKIVLSSDAADTPHESGRDAEMPDKIGNRNAKEMMAEVYGTEKMTRQMRDAAKVKYVVLAQSELDNHDIIDLLERVPALHRDQRFNEELRAIRLKNSTNLAHTPPRPDSSDDSPAPSSSKRIVF